LQADELDWRAAGSEHCKYPTSSADCQAVEAYIAKHPAGTQAGEATRILRTSSVKLASLKKSEEAQVGAAHAARQLCRTLLTLDQLEEADKMQRRIDAESGTVDLYQKRQNATGRVYLRDQRQKLMNQIADAGLRFDRMRVCGEAPQ
jgi:hypothetical protein